MIKENSFVILKKPIGDIAKNSVGVVQNTDNQHFIVFFIGKLNIFPSSLKVLQIKRAIQYLEKHRQKI